MKTNPIQNYILKSERNLRIAFAVNKALPEVRKRMVQDFLDRLDFRLKKMLKGWDSKRCGGDFFVDEHPWFQISKAAWKHRSIVLMFGNYGKKMSIGIFRETGDTREIPLYAPLLRAVQMIHPSAKSYEWWEAWVALHSPASDWSKPEVLCRMFRDAKFLEEVANQILEIANVSERILNQLERKK